MRSDWRVYAKRADFKGIAGKYGIDQVIARIIRNRDICGDAAIDMYLNGDINDMHNPESMKDAVLSVDIITQKIIDNYDSKQSQTYVTPHCITTESHRKSKIVNLACQYERI